MLEQAQREFVQKHKRGVLTTVKRDGSPQMSVIAYQYDPERELVRISVTDDRAKTRNLRRDPRASLLIAPPSLRGYLVLEGKADISDVAAEPDDEVVEELAEIYRAVAGEHPDWDEFRQAMVDERRLILRIPVEHSYGWLAA